MPSPDAERAGLGSRPAQEVTNHSDTAKGSSAEFEALVFIDGARRWLDHGLAGHVGIIEAAVAAQLLCARAERLALAA